jgi:subtilisin family serine protease
VPDDPGVLALHLDVRGLAESVAPLATDLRLTIERVEAVMEPDLLDGTGRLDVEQVVVLNPLRARRRLSLTWSSNTTPQGIGEFIVVPGRVHQVRYLVSEADVLVDGAWEPLHIPSGDTSGLKFVVQGEPGWLEMVDQEVTTAVATLDLGHNGQLHRNANGLQLRPTLPTHAVPYEMRAPFGTDRLLVHFAPETPPAQREALRLELQAEDLIDAGDVRLWRVPARDPGAILALQDQLAQRPELLTASVDPIWRAASQRNPDDPLYQAGVQTALGQIGAPGGWVHTAGSQEVIVAVVDAGFDIEHPDLVDNLWVNPGELPRIDGPSCSGTPPYDFLGAFANLSAPADGVFTLRDLNRPTSTAVRDDALTELRLLTGLDLRASLDGNADFFSGVDLMRALANGCDDDPSAANGAINVVDDILGAGIFYTRAGSVISGDPRARDGAPDRIAEPGVHETRAGAMHGTAMASIIGAAGDNGYGMTGVAQNVRLMLVNVSEDGETGVTTKSATTAIDYATKRGARVVSMSLAAEQRDLRDEQEDELENEWYQVLDHVIRPSSGVLVAAAGSSLVVQPSGVRTGYDLDSPGPYTTLPAGILHERMLVVTAARADKGGLLTTANWGRNHVHVAAPGEDVPALGWGLYGLDEWTDVDGTSPATALAAGAAALVVARCDIGGESLISALKDGANSEPAFTNYVEGGRFLKVPGAMDAGCR